MPSPFHGISLASTALRSFQRAMETVGHNMANVNTKGYSRQQVDFQPLDPTSFWSYGRVALGSGVAIQGIARTRASFLDTRMQTATSEFGKSNTLSTGLSRVEALYNEPGDLGIANALDTFFNDWSNLASNPGDSTARFSLRNSAATLTQRVQQVYGGLEEMTTGAKQDISGVIQQINDLGQTVAKLNQQIRQSATLGEVPNDLLDQRTQALNDLSSLVNINTIEHGDSTVSVYISNVPLVSDAEHVPLSATYDATTQTLQSSGVTVPIRGGQLLGQFQLLQRIQGAMTNLDDLANNLRTQVNAIHSTGINLLGNTGVNFFADQVPQTGARDFALDPAILASTDAIASGISGNAGDGALALSISQLRDSKIASLNNKTLSEFYRDSVAEVSKDAAYYSDLSDTHGQILQQIDDQIQSVSGVSLDDEMADLMRFQRSYQAAAKVLTIMDQTTEDLINIIR